MMRAAQAAITVGALMIALSIVLLLMNVPGAAIYNTLQFGGVALGVIGLVTRWSARRRTNTLGIEAKPG